MMNRHDAANFETAVIRDGMDVDIVLRRRGLPILDHLTPPERKAVETYAAVFEAVAAGGATLPRDTLAPRQGGAPSGPSREGRQSQVVDQAAFLRRMAAAVVARPDLIFGKRKPVRISAIAVWHSFVVDGMHVKGVLLRCGVRDGRALAPATATLLAEVRSAAAAVLSGMAGGRSPFSE